VWTSWLFTAGQWQRVAVADDLESASTALGVAARRAGVRDNRCYGLTGGAPPTWTPTMPSKASRIAQEASKPTEEGDCP
jgi:hypothetical protein